MKKIISLLLACTMVMCLFAAGTVSASADAKNEVNVYVEGTIPTLDPFATGEYTACYVFNNVYEPIVRIDENGDVMSNIAKDWTVSDDGLVYTINIVEGAKFHNGEELKASDVVFSLNTAMGAAAMEGSTNMMESAEATGDYTFTLTLKAPYAALISMLSNIYVVNEAFYSAQDSNYDVACGTGAYMLRDGAVDLNTGITLDRFDDYRNGQPAIETVNLKIITDSSTASILLETGDLDFLMVSTPSYFAPLADSGNYNTALMTARHTAYIALNTTKAPLDNKALRQALNYATDNETIVIIAYEGLAVPARALTGPDSFGVDFTDATDFSFDIEKAQEKLAEAGYPDGIDLSEYGILLEYIPGSYHEKIANCLKESWAQAGINIELRATESVDCAAGAHTMRTTGTSYTADMSYMAGKYASWNIGSENYGFYANDRADEIFTLTQGMTDQAERAKLYKELTEIIVDDCPYIPIQHKETPYVWAKDLNAKVYPSNMQPWFIYEWSWN